MRRIISAATLVGFVLGITPAVRAQGYGGYGGYTYPVQSYSYQGYGQGYGYPVQQVGYQEEQYPVLKKILIGGALVGVGFLAGRLTAPQPDYNYYQAPQQPQYLPGGYHHSGYRHGGHDHDGHGRGNFSRAGYSHGRSGPQPQYRGRF